MLTGRISSIIVIALCSLFLSNCSADDDIITDSGEAVPTIYYTPVKDTVSDSCNIYWGMDSDSGTYLDQEFFFNNFSIDREIPYWVGYHISPSKLEINFNTSPSFTKDPALPNKEQASDADYTNSGYDRGHNAPAADFRRSEEAYRSTYRLTNVSPQKPYLNQNLWRMLEEKVRGMVIAQGNGWVFTGNLFLDHLGDSTPPDSFIANGQVAVPTHLFKTVLLMSDDSLFEMCAWMMSNRPDTLSGEIDDYRVTVDELEEHTGYDFYFKLEDTLEDSLEEVLGCTAVDN